MNKQNGGKIILFGIIAILFVLLPLWHPAELPLLLLWLGRFHPLVLHFPIVLIILSLIAEVASRAPILKPTERIVEMILVMSVIASIVAVVAGFFLFSSGDYSGPLVERHFWAGSLTTAFIAATTALYYRRRSGRTANRIYLGSLIATNALMIYTSHVGGTITHGSDFLTSYLPAIVNEPAPENKAGKEMLVYGDVIAPILEIKCAGCHNSTRAKGSFVVNNFQSLFRKGESGHPGIDRTNPEQSELLSRINLPDDNDDHMPPQGKTPLTSKELELIDTWIKRGASQTATAYSSDSLKELVSSVVPDVRRYLRRASINKLRDDQLSAELSGLAKELGIVIQRDSSADEGMFTVSMSFPPESFTGGDLKKLVPYADHISALSLISSSIDDEGLYFVGQMENVKLLFLQNTKITGTGLVYLQRMKTLELINLSFTDVDDKSCIDLLQIPNLKAVYLYRTKTTMPVIDAMRKNRPSVQFLLEEGPYF